MKKNLIIMHAFLSSIAFAQVGINTANPSAMLDIVSKGNTDETHALKITNSQGNPMMNVFDNGNVGIGTGNIIPTAKLHVASENVSEAFQMQDGSQGTGKILTSDSNGKASWINISAMEPIAYGQMNTKTIEIDSKLLIGHKITLKPGKWLIYLGQLVRSNQAADSNYNMWIRFTVSSSQTNITRNGFNFMASSLISGWMAPATVSTGGVLSLAKEGYSFINGVIPINVTSNSPITLYVWTNETQKTSLFGGGLGSSAPIPFVGDNGENYFFAIPSA